MGEVGGECTKPCSRKAQGSETEALVINSLRDGGEQVFSKRTCEGGDATAVSVHSSMCWQTR